MEKVFDMKYLIYDGLHFHLGSQIYDLSSYPLAIEEVVKVIRKINDLYDIEIPKLDLGGGLGIKYLASDTPPTIAYFVDLLVDALKKEVKKNNITMASNYNGLTKPAVVLVNKGKSGLMVKRETYADLVKNDVIPEWF